jgi:hypothetical protein
LAVQGDVQRRLVGADQAQPEIVQDVSVLQRAAKLALQDKSER